jgi:subtilisin-like proprotein convertase family protein
MVSIAGFQGTRGSLPRVGLGVLLACSFVVPPAYGGIVTIDDATVATPYPDPIVVAGELPVTRDVNVRLNDLHHEAPADIDLLLVGPSGQTVVLLSDAGPSTGPSDVDLTFDDQAPAPVPDPLASGAYKPTDLDDGLPDLFPSPAPPGPFGSQLADFRGANANGTWQLFAVDDEVLGTGLIDGWSLSITGRNAAPLRLPSTIASGEPTGVVRVVINRGPPPPNPPPDPPLQAGRVDYETGPAASGTQAAAGIDYAPLRGTVEFAPGEYSKTIEIPLIDDRVPEGSEQFALTLGSTAGDARTTPFDTSVTLAIGDDDPRVTRPFIRFAATQRVLKQRGVIIRARSNADGLLTATGTIALPRRAAATIRLRGVRRQVTRGQLTTVKLGMARKHVRAVKRAFAKKRRLTARVSVTATDLAGGRAVARSRVALKR